MNFDEWEPIYLQILKEFGFSRLEDEVAGVTLFNLLAGKNLVKLQELEGLIREKTVCVIGDAPGSIDKLPDAELYIAADGATKKLIECKKLPGIITTDLDGDVGVEIKANAKGSIVIIHAHGDNIQALEKYVPKFRGKILGSTQSTPYTRLVNFGGFTDGDRAVCLASHFRAREILLKNFDFEDVSAERPEDREVKLKKLGWARKIIEECSKKTVIKFV
ncbi:MAG: 6-hydroxymethylpterin diphosphokinase MptE-like protein [Thermoplasmata archaeon]